MFVFVLLGSWKGLHCRHAGWRFSMSGNRWSMSVRNPYPPITIQSPHNITISSDYIIPIVFVWFVGFIMCLCSSPFFGPSARNTIFSKVFGHVWTQKTTLKYSFRRYLELLSDSSPPKQVIFWFTVGQTNSIFCRLPSGKHIKNYGKSPCLGKSTVNCHFQ